MRLLGRGGVRYIGGGGEQNRERKCEGRREVGNFGEDTCADWELENGSVTAKRDEGAMRE